MQFWETWVTKEGCGEVRDDGVAGEAHQDGDDADAQEWTEEAPGGQPADEERYTILKEERVRVGKDR